jgi:O-methyltransferase
MSGYPEDEMTEADEPRNPPLEDSATEVPTREALRALAAAGSETRAAFFDRIVAELLPLDHAPAFWGDRLLSLDKSAGFLDDPAFAAAFAAIKDAHAYDHYRAPHTVAWRLHTLVWAARNGLALDGDFVECGVFRGHFTWVVSEVVGFADAARTFYLYDTFEGFAPAYSSQADFPDWPEFFDFANAIYKDPRNYTEVLRRFGGRPNFRIVRGILPDILSETVPDKIAYLHLDLNSPAAEVGTLEILFDRIVPGGFLVLDDYGWSAYRKGKAAEDAFMAQRGYQILELPTGQGLVVKRPGHT